MKSKTPPVMSGPSRAAAEGSQKEQGVKLNTSVTDPPNNKALTAWNDSMITHGSSLNPAQVHDPRFVKKSFSMIYTRLIHQALCFPLSDHILPLLF